MTGDINRILEGETPRHSIFLDKSKLSPDYVPEKLVHRNEEFTALENHFEPVLEGVASRKALITGAAGVGKTAIARRFAQEFEARAGERDLDLVQVHVNCRINRSPHKVAKEVVRELPVQVQAEGFSPQEIMDEAVDYLTGRSAHILITLDEIDYFVKRNGPDLLYSLTRTSETSDDRDRVSLIATSFSKRFLESLDEATRSTFHHRTVELNEYGAGELSDILEQRAKLAFEVGAVRDDSIDLISETASGRGDARFALELLLHAGMIAGRPDAGTVTPNHVRKAKGKLDPGIGREVLIDLDEHKLLYLLALSRHHRSTDVAFLSGREVESTYGVMCEEYGVEPLPREDLKLYVQEMDSSNLIDAKRPQEDRERAREKVGLLDVSPGAMEDAVQKVLGFLEKGSLEDRSD